MIALLDTCTLLWTLDESSRLSASVKEAIVNPRNEVSVSTVSFWEISLKHALGKLPLHGFEPDDLEEIMREAGFNIIGLNEHESSSVYRLPAKDNHKDPFDRMLIWQAITRGMTLMSNDAQFAQYREHSLRLFW
jgi:PIN domain nuclease of toxin-antitoxin system